MTIIATKHGPVKVYGYLAEMASRGGYQRRNVARMVEAAFDRQAAARRATWVFWIVIPLITLACIGYLAFIAYAYCAAGFICK